MLTQTKPRVVSENPFNGSHVLLELGRDLYKHTTQPAIFNLLNKAWASCKTADQKRLFYIIVFSVGDIQNREHRILKKTVQGSIDAGGNSMRLQFFYCLQWIIANDVTNFFQLMPLIQEYTNVENIFYYQVRTDRKKGTLLEKRSLIPTAPDKRVEFIQHIAGYLAYKMTSTDTLPVEHETIAKYLHTPKFSTRKRNYINKKTGERKIVRTPIKDFTREKEQFEYDLCKEISTQLSWQIVVYPKNTRFLGIENYKKLHLVQTEATLFASKEILDFEESSFHNWLNRIPSDARYRVQRRLFKKEGEKLIPNPKWNADKPLSTWYTNWVDAKNAALETVKTLEAKEQTTLLTEQEKVQLAVAKKESKVNVGATNFLDLFSEFAKSALGNHKELEIKAQNMLAAVTCEVPVLTIVDTSGSMSGPAISHNGASFTRIDLARIAATIFLAKNPNPELAHLLGFFSNVTRFVTDGDTALGSGTNRFLQGTATVVKKLYDKKSTFIDNYVNISKFLNASGYTDIGSAATKLLEWVKGGGAEDFERRKDIINGYQVIVVISDGEFNNKGNSTSSLIDFKHKLTSVTGWNGVVVVWDVCSPSPNKNPFEGVDNMIYYGATNPSVLTQLFKNIHDLDVIDIYEPLLALFRSNRYTPIKETVIV